MIRKFDEVAPESNIIVNLIFLKDIYLYSEQVQKAMTCIQIDPVFTETPSE